MREFNDVRAHAGFRGLNPTEALQRARVSALEWPTRRARLRFGWEPAEFVRRPYTIPTENVSMDCDDQPVPGLGIQAGLDDSR
jgi:hypothetical protein